MEWETDRSVNLNRITHSGLEERSQGAQVRQRGKTVDTADRRNPVINQGETSARRFYKRHRGNNQHDMTAITYPKVNLTHRHGMCNEHWRSETAVVDRCSNTRLQCLQCEQIFRGVPSARQSHSPNGASPSCKK